MFLLPPVAAQDSEAERIYTKYHVEKRHAFSRTTQGILNTRKGIPFLYGCIVFTFCLSSKTTFILIEAIKKAKNSTFLLTFVATEGYK